MKHISVFAFLGMCAFAMIILFGHALTDMSKHETEIYRRHDAEVRSHIGRKAVILKDTFIVVDYSGWHNSYILNNGQKVDLRFLEKVEIK